MRISRRFAAILALAAAGAVAVAGIAMAAADGNSSTVSMKFSPNKVPKKKYKSGKINVHTHTDFAHPGVLNQGGFVTRAQVYFDDDIKLNTGSAPTCKASLGNIDMAAAMAACGKSLIGTGTAHAQPTVDNCVLDFNGPKKGGKPSVLLFTRVGTTTCGSPKTNHSGGGSIVLSGVLKSAHGDFGRVLDVNPVYPSATLPLDDFNTTIKKGRYVQARCHDHNKTWNMKAKFTYSDGQHDTAHAKQKCKVKH